jgi:hypothetical protein
MIKGAVMKNPLMCTLPILFVAGILLPLEAAFLAPWVGENVKLGNDPAALPSGTGKNQAEPHVIRSFMDPDLILATFQEGRFSDGGARANGFAVSEDGGFTWRRSLNPGLTTVANGRYIRATDPVGGIDLEDTLYLNSLASLDDQFGIAELVVQRSTDRGQSWSQPLIVYSGFSEGPGNRVFPDKNWMVVNDYPDTPTSGRIVVTWTNFRTIVDEFRDIQDFVIMSSFSDTRGNTWSPATFVTPPGGTTFSREQFQGSQPVFLPGGGLAIVYHRFQGSTIEVIYSPDGGKSYPFGAVPVHSGYILYDAPNMRDGSFLPSVSVARETGDLYIAYTSMDSPGASTGFIYFVRSDRQQKGTSPATAPLWNFRAPLRVSGRQPARSVNTPTISVSPDGQWVTVYFFDNRNDPGGDTAGDFYAVQSTDGGETWTDPFRITETTFDLTRATNTERGYMIGDYFGLAAPRGPDQAAVAVWVDTREGTADPWSARIGSLEQSVFKSWLQARLPWQERENDVEAMRLADPDLDETPNLLEYILGQSPRTPEPVPDPTTGPQLLSLHPGTDPETQVTVTGLNGKWPTDGNLQTLPSQSSSFGEGFWSSLSWPPAADIGQIAFTVNQTERWHLLAGNAHVRWVRAFEGGWSWSPWFGWLYTEASPWLFHLSLGWVYDLEGVLYSPLLETYLYPDHTSYPWIIGQDGTYRYVLQDAPWVYEAATQAWIRMY